MEYAREEYLFGLGRLRFEPIIAAGSIQCRRCGSREVITMFVQTRSADEPMTGFNKCYSCKNEWKS